jgi:DnaJ-class molecular chaperone
MTEDKMSGKRRLAIRLADMTEKCPDCMGIGRRPNVFRPDVEIRCWQCHGTGRRKAKKCGVCGVHAAFLESPAEGYTCAACGASDSDE